MTIFRSWRNVVVLVICATLAFGGSFVCVASSDDDDDIDFPSTRND
jgi:hypothetical protein